MELEVPCIGFGMGRLTLDLHQGNGSLLCWELLLHAVVCGGVVPWAEDDYAMKCMRLLRHQSGWVRGKVLGWRGR